MRRSFDVDTGGIWSRYRQGRKEVGRAREKAGAEGRVTMRRSVLHALVPVCLVCVAGISNAEDYPSRPITLVVPFPPGGSTTVIVRIVGDTLSTALGQQVVVGNQRGACAISATR